MNYGGTTYQDPTNIAQRDGYQYDYATTGSGIGIGIGIGIGYGYVNAKWMFEMSGLYQLPYQVNVSAFYNARQGYPFERSCSPPSRPNGGGIASILLDPIGESRLPNYQNVDFHVERPLTIGVRRVLPVLDVFNLLNANTVQAIRGRQNSAVANNIQAVLAPRVVRFGIRVQF